MGTNYQFIDTTTNIIEGYEPEKNSVKIDLMREGIKEGHDFPAVEMVKTGKKREGQFCKETMNLDRSNIKSLSQKEK